MSTTVSIQDTTVVVNGHVVEGWSEDADALMLPDIDLATVTRGADGRMVASSTGNRGGEVRFKLQANSPSTQFFSQQVATIIRGGAVVFNGTIRNSRMGISIRLERGVLSTAPAGQTLGKGSAAAREFAFEFETVLPNYDGARFTGPPELT